MAERRADQIEAARYLLIDQCDQQGTLTQNFLVALDMIGAGPGEMVLVSQGSAARQTDMTYDRPMDAVVVGIIDLIDEQGNVVYDKMSHVN